MLAEEFGSDTDDDDYIPEGEGHEASEEENSGDEENPGEGGKKRKGVTAGKKKKKIKQSMNVFARGGFQGESRDWEKELEEEKKEINEEKEKKKAEDIWAEFKSDVGKKSVVEPKKTSSNLSSLFSPVPVTSDTNPAIDKVVNKPKSRLSSLFDPTPCQPETKPEKIKPKSLLGSIFDDVDKSKPEQTSSVEPGAVSSGESGAAAEPRAASSEKPVTLDPGKVAITKVFDFAGEVVKITKEVDAESSEAKKFLKKQEETGPATSGIRKGGLASVVGSIGKKVKMGCLDKSKLDWNQFVTEEGIKEDLASHNRGKDGYVDKQMFLERADLRQFEIEKAIREKNRKSLMK